MDGQGWQVHGAADFLPLYQLSVLLLCCYCGALRREMLREWGESTPNRPQIFLQPLCWHPWLQLRTAKWSPAKNTGKVTQKQRETAVPHHGAWEHISRGETRGEARVSPNKSSSSNSSPGRDLQKIPSTCQPQPSSFP